MSLKLLKNSEDCRNYVKSDNIQVLEFAAEWAPESKPISACIDLLAKKNTSITFARVQAEDAQEFCQALKVDSVPTVLLVKCGSVLSRVTGSDPASLTDIINEYAADTPEPKAAESLQERLGKLIKRSKVMLFMKGSPDAPRCGFSRQVIDLLAQQDIEYDHFDILGDEEVRQGLKVFSNWPTYPQLYVNGDLVGGLDIIKELIEQDELKSACS